MDQRSRHAGYSKTTIERVLAKCSHYVANSVGTPAIKLIDVLDPDDRGSELVNHLPASLAHHRAAARPCFEVPPIDEVAVLCECSKGKPIRVRFKSQ